MPPEQCPECGRFLKRALVESLAVAPAACPKCEVELTASMFGAAPAAAPPAVAEPAVEEADVGEARVAAEAAAVVSPSVRPPDLTPATVRDPDDPLAGWDAGVPLPPVGDRRPFPTDTVVVAAGAALGAVAGSLLTERRARGGAAGALVGAVLAGAARRIWRLPEA